MKFNLSEWALANHKVVGLLVMLCVLGGLWGYYSMPKLEDPEIKVRQGLVVGIYPGASAHEVELELADPIEKAVLKMADMEFVESYCYSDMCYVLVTQATTVPPEQLQGNWDLMRHHLERMALPEGAQLMIRDDFGDVSGMFFALTAKDMSARRLTDYAEMLKRELRQLDDVGRIDIFGEEQPCINIVLRQDKCAALGVLPIEVVATLKEQMAHAYAGYFESGGHRVRLRVDSRVQTQEEIGALLIRAHDGAQLHLSDLADIVPDVERPVRQQIYRGGERAVGLLIAASGGSDIVKVGRRVEQKLEELRQDRLPAGMKIEKVFFQPERVRTAMSTFLLNLVESVALVVLVLMFCMDMRTGSVVGAVLVVTVLGSIFLLYHSGGTLQRVSLGAFILAMGMLVDNSIVIADGIWVSARQGVPRHEALTAIGGRTAIPLLAATLIAVLAFLPIFLSPDMTGLYVHDLFVVLAISLLLSWVLALTLVPIVANRYFNRLTSSDNSKESTTNELYNGPVYRLFRRILQVTLAHRHLSVTLVVVLLVLSGLGYLLLPKGLFPDMEYDQAYMEYRLPEGSSPAQVKRDLDSIRHDLEQLPYIQRVTNITGASPGRYNLVRSVAMPSLAYGELIIDFDKPHSVNKYLPQLQQQFNDAYPDAYLCFKKYNLMFMPYPIELRFLGNDPAVLHQLADSVRHIAHRLRLLDPITTDWEERVPTLDAGYMQQQALLRGVSRSDVGISLLAATDGVPIGICREGTENLPLYLRVGATDGGDLTDVASAPLFRLMPDASDLIGSRLAGLLSGRQQADGLSASLSLDEVGDGVHVDWEDPVVCHYDGQRCHGVKGVPAPGLGTEEARALLEKAISHIQLPPGYSYKWGGEKLATDMSMRYLFKFYPLTLLLMLIVLVWLFRSYSTAILLFCCVPFVFVGVIPAMLLTGQDFGFVAIVGALGLVGMMFKNGILLIDEIRLQQRSGVEFSQALIGASMSRMRPVMLASLTTVLGMVPLLFDSMFCTMAATIVGGLLAGTVVVLIFLPVLYSLMVGEQEALQEGMA